TGSLAVSHSDGALVGTECNGTITRTYTITDACGNSTDVDQVFTVTDDTVPTITNCPDEIEVYADAGSCTASVTFGGATATDNCDPAPAITYWIGGTQITSPYTFPGGVTTVTVKAKDACNNVNDTCTFTVTVLAYNEMLVGVQLKGMSTSGTLTRCITFTLYKCFPTATWVTENEDITFTNGLATNVPLLVTCNTAPYTCITARDKLHTLRRIDEGFTIIDAQYVADFTGDDWLIGGNLNDDDWIDIVDFGIYVNRWATHYDSDGDTVDDGNTPCAWTPTPKGPYHADISGDGSVATGDFTYIQQNFLAESEANCCSLPFTGEGPRTEISVAELRQLGLGELVTADLNADGWLDQDDVVAFLEGARPRPRPQPRPRPVPAPLPTADPQGMAPTQTEESE
ncbi:MAG: HYR domain-containing protein, partial [Planctomycetota bacterium]